MRDLRFLVGAGQVEEQAAVGAYLRIKSASVPLLIEIDGGQSRFEIAKGGSVNLKPFKRFSVSHSSPVDQAIVIAIGDEGEEQTEGVMTGEVAVSGWAKAANIAGAVSTQYEIGPVSQMIMGFAASRRGVKVKNMSTVGTAYLRFATSNFPATQANSWPLGPGEELDLGFANTGYCMAIADALSVKLAVIEGIGS